MTKNKLTIEYLAAYLPYGLKVKCADTGEIMTMDGISGKTTMEAVIIEKGEEMCRLLAIDKYYDSEEYGIPCLRPLSQLTQEIEHNGERFVPIVELAKIAENDHWHDSEVRYKSSEHTHGIGWTENETRYVFAYSTEHKGFFLESIPHHQLIIANQHKLFQMMFSWHMDVFGLLDQNLALPIED